MKILYFAWLREKVGTAEETVELPPQINTADTLLAWLGDRHDGLRDVLASGKVVRIAVNHEYAADNDPVTDTDEVALFPPVTGG